MSSVSVAFWSAVEVSFSTASSVSRPAGPETDIAAAVGASGNATAMQRTPISCSLSSTA